jgi:hypothetical protein
LHEFLRALASALLERAVGSGCGGRRLGSNYRRNRFRFRVNDWCRFALGSGKPRTGNQDQLGGKD